MDVVYVVRDGGNPELRFSLRSLVNLPHDRVWIVGHLPEFVAGDVGYIPTRQGTDRFANMRNNWIAACQRPDVSDQFVHMNDDFYVVKPVDAVPALHAGLLEDHAARSTAVRAQAMRATADVLRASCCCTIDSRDGTAVDREAGCAAHTNHAAGPLSYELHVPMVVDKAGFAAALALCAGNARMMPRTLYGNTAGVGGDLESDVKVRRDDTHIPDGPFISSEDASFTPTRIGEHITGLFPRPGPYEVRR